MLDWQRLLNGSSRLRTAISLSIFLIAFLTQPAVGDCVTVIASCGNASPSIAAIDEVISTSLSAKATGYSYCPFGPKWSWLVGSVQFSAEGTSWTNSPGGDTHWIVWPSSLSASATLYSTSSTDAEAGYWKVDCTATAECSASCSGSSTTTAQETKATIFILRTLDKNDGNSKAGIG